MTRHLRAFRGAQLAFAALIAALALFSLSTFDGSSAEAAGPTTLGRTPWQVFEPATYVAPVPNYGTHGNISYYNHAPAIPGPADAGWKACGPTSPLRPSPYAPTTPLCPNDSTVGMVVGSRLPGCMTNADFTFFQTFVDIPLGTTLSTFTIAMSGMDDGARITLFNSANVGGLVIPGSYVFLGGSGTSNLAPHVVAGETNRVVITQVDDCAVGNNLQNASVNLNGTVIPPTPTADLSIVKTGPATVNAGANFNYTLSVSNTGPASATGVTVNDGLPPSLKFISAGPGCTHDGSVSGGLVTCQIPSIGVGATIPLNLTVQALSVGTVTNNAAITATGNVADSNGANNQSTATTSVVEPPPPSAPPFSIPGASPTANALVCIPPYMNENLSTQYWWARADGSGALVVNLYAVAVNAAEAGSVAIRVYSPANVLEGTASVAHPASGESAAVPVVIAAPAAGSLHRIEVRITAPPSGPVARHYRLSLGGASLLGMNSTTQAQAEHDDVTWRVNVGAGEPLNINVLPAPSASLNTGTLQLIPPGGGAPAATVALTAAGGSASVAAPAAGQWNVVLSNLNGHYLLQKAGGADTGIYAAWNTWGKAGPFVITVLNFNGTPATTPVTVEVTGPDGTQAFPGVVGSITLPMLEVGRYTVRLAGDAASVPMVATCGGQGGAELRLPNTPPEALDDWAGTTVNASVGVDVRANDSDADGHALTVTAVTPGANGTVTTDGATVTYTPNMWFVGTDSFTYTVSDGNGGFATATVTITVKAQFTDGRMTGGGNITTGKGKEAKRWTWGFELRCNATNSNFQYQDHTGGNFHMTSITSAVCVDNPAIGEGVPTAGFDSLYFTGVGRWNGVDGYLVEATVTDGGEPGSRDTIAVTVKTAGGTVVSTVTGLLNGGNQQAHG